MEHTSGRGTSTYIRYAASYARHPADLPKCSAESIREFIARECTPDKLTVVGVNVAFDELCKWTARSFAEQGTSFSAAPAAEGLSPRADMAPAKYTGGDLWMSRPNPLCHLIFGWEVPGGWNGKWLAAATVLQMFLGGGGSFSTGGPGKGMHTRFFTEILNRHHWVESCQASTVMYIDSGLFTVYATTVPNGAKDFCDVLARVFEGVKVMTKLELDRAKNALSSSIHMNLEMRAVMMEDLGRQMVLSGKVGTAKEFTRMVEEVEKEDLIEVMRVVLSSRPSIVAFGAIDKVPSFEVIEQKFKGVRLPDKGWMTTEGKWAYQKWDQALQALIVDPDRSPMGQQELIALLGAMAEAVKRRDVIHRFNATHQVSAEQTGPSKFLLEVGLRAPGVADVWSGLEQLQNLSALQLCGTQLRRDGLRRCELANDIQKMLGEF
eukprot:s3602_g1.t1